MLNIFSGHLFFHFSSVPEHKVVKVEKNVLWIQWVSTAAGNMLTGWSFISEMHLSLSVFVYFPQSFFFSSEAGAEQAATTEAIR